MASPFRNARCQRGFTLIELLVAIAILGILGTVVITNLWDNVDEANQVGTHTKLRQVKDVVQSYRRKHGELPDDLMRLTEEDPKNGNRPWLKEEDLHDTWSNLIMLKKGDRPGEFEIVSFGSDGQENGFGMELGYERDLSSDRPLDVEEDK
jgi:general secretion pathway protein G